MKNVGIILGYGVFIPPNPEYQSYLDQAKNLILEKGFDTTIITGSFTNPKYPHLSEASSIFDYFLSQSNKLNIILEDQSLTTYQNLLFSKDIISTRLKTLDSVFIIADSIRVPKVFFHSLEIFSPLFLKAMTTEDRLRLLATESRLHDPDTLPNPIAFSFEKLTVQGISLSNDSKSIAHQIISSLIESHYLEYPSLHREFIAWRQKKWGIK
ncbi:MAG: ElyC/SanA/YdcF family protein [Patescibacteria group bacterium]